MTSLRSPRRLRLAPLVGTLIALATAPGVAAAPFAIDGTGSAPVPRAAISVKLQLRASGLSKPVLITTARDGTGRLFIVEQTGRIKVYRYGAVDSTPFLSITSQVSTGSEQGLLGLAFHPSFKTNHKLYVDFTDVNGDTVIREYRTSSSNPNVVDPSTARLILKVTQPYDNHNGGMLAFGPDGYLYIGMGDGGSAGDPGNRAQSTGGLLGKILRIDIDHSTSTTHYRSPSTNPYVGRAGLDQIWSRGLRNPWRFSFDRVTGQLWIGDVGQSRWEEVDRSSKVE